MGKLFGTDGVRGIANEELSCERSLLIGRALGKVLREKRGCRPTVLLGMDTRISSPMLGDAMCAGLLSVGVDVCELGVLPTPAVAYLVKKEGASAGVMISASHNPFEYNGIKIFGEGGYKLSDELEEKIEKIVLDGTSVASVSPSELGRKIKKPSLYEDYVNYIISSGGPLDGMRIGIDTSNGSCSNIAERIFSSLGALTYMIGDAPDGLNINLDCGSTHLGALQELVKKERLDLGVAFDGDGDRCLAVDSEGREINGDFIMAIMAEKMKHCGALKKSTVVGTVMTNYGFIKFCEESGISFISTRVGDRYVLDEMRRGGFSLGGEQSGHIIFSDYATTGDGLLTAVLLLSCVKKAKKPLKELSCLMKGYPQYSENIPAKEAHKVEFNKDDKIKKILKEAEAEISGKGKIVARPSGTEPYIRITVEGEDREKTKLLLTNLKEKIEARLSALVTP